MGRPRGSRNRSKIADDEYGVNTVSGDELRDYIERIEHCNNEQKEISSDRQQIFKELKMAGYDRETVREIVRKRKLTAEQRDAAEALMEEYMTALGDYAGTPLGRAGADRLRGEARP
jgi:uncharacterized protein (UPF0335 family)